MGVTPDAMLAAAERLSWTIPTQHHEDYLKLLGKTDAACQAILAEPGLSLFSRVESHLTSPQTTFLPPSSTSFHGRMSTCLFQMPTRILTGPGPGARKLGGRPRASSRGKRSC